jgi:predicted phage terminase large subunit-like protein
MVKYYRQRARTDLVFLCNELLGYPDVSWKIHGEMIGCLQQFYGGIDNFNIDGKDRAMIPMDGSSYVPFCPNIYDLPGNRNNMILFSRDCLKSTVANIAHTIQWIINFPYIRVLLNTAIGDQAELFTIELLKHFRFNETFRFFFPEFCPHGNVAEWGNLSGFTCPLKDRIEPLYRNPTKEPTFSYKTVGSVVSSGHVDVEKFDDIVDKENVKTKDQIRSVNSHFSMMEPLIQNFQIDKMKAEIYEKYGNTGWRDVIGTRYDFGDLYGVLIDDEERRKTLREDIQKKATEEAARLRQLGDDRQATSAEVEAAKRMDEFRPIWRIYLQSALKKGTSARDPQAEAYWPERLPLRRLIDIEDDPFEPLTKAYSQYYLNPLPPKSGLVSSQSDIVFVPRKVIDEIMPHLRLHVAIDLHGMEDNEGNDFTVVNYLGFGRDGRPYVVNIWRARYGPEEVIDLMFRIHEGPHGHRIREFKIQKDHFARVLMPFFEREKARRLAMGRTVPNVIAMPINNQRSKEQKIKGLRPWFRNKDVRFPDDLSCRHDLTQEILKFPKCPHDDILDTLADHLESWDGEVNPDVRPMPTVDPAAQKTPARLFDKFIGFGANGEPMFSNSQSNNDSLQMTGIL